MATVVVTPAPKSHKIWLRWTIMALPMCVSVSQRKSVLIFSGNSVFFLVSLFISFILASLFRSQCMYIFWENSILQRIFFAERSTFPIPFAIAARECTIQFFCYSSSDWLRIFVPYSWFTILFDSIHTLREREKQTQTHETICEYVYSIHSIRTPRFT